MDSPNQIATKIVETITPKIHKFSESKIESDKSSEKLDKFFSGRFNITKANMILDLHGIDRIFECRKTENRLTVEYKADIMAGNTGQFFVETRVKKNPGWMLTSLCQVLVIHVPLREKAYWFDFLAFKRYALKSLKEGAVKKTVQNIGYDAEGILVPIHLAKELATIFEIPTNL
jgi:hypothetical protein